MDLSDQLKDPVWAAVFAAAATAAYIYVKAQMNNEGPQQLSVFAKPASLVAILVYFIVSTGGSSRERISTDPF